MILAAVKRGVNTLWPKPSISLGVGQLFSHNFSAVGSHETTAVNIFLRRKPLS